jgi:hypothetical protein
VPRKAKMCALKWKQAEWARQGLCAGCEVGNPYLLTLA